MCKLCLREICPDRGSLCIESGAYLLNFVKCHGCGKRGSLEVFEREEEEEEEEGGEYNQEITYKHRCSCGHIVAEHHYTFCASSDTQDFSM